MIGRGSKIIAIVKSEAAKVIYKVFIRNVRNMNDCGSQGS